jgi:hypothetical protein
MGPLGIMERPFDTNPNVATEGGKVLNVPTTIMLRISHCLLRQVAPMGKGGIGSRKI